MKTLHGFVVKALKRGRKEGRRAKSRCRLESEREGAATAERFTKAGKKEMIR